MAATQTSDRTYATGKRKNAVARVYVRPGTGVITVNGRTFEMDAAAPEEIVAAGSTHVWELDKSGPAMMNMRALLELRFSGSGLTATASPRRTRRARRDRAAPIA